jgi:two-component system, OmpR family, sensor histidine kinase BaeS
MEQGDEKGRGRTSIFLAFFGASLRTMDRTLFDRLYIKLFAAIAGAIAALTVAAYLVFVWSFERGFVDYLNRADEVRLELMAERLADGYAREQSWAWIANDRQRWSEISREALGLPPPNTPTDMKAPPRRDTPLTIDPRLLLFDEARNQLIGRPESAPRAVLKPITTGARTVGYLGYVPRPEIVASIESAYVRRQHLAFGAIAGGMLLAALGLGAGLAARTRHARAYPRRLRGEARRARS